MLTLVRKYFNDAKGRTLGIYLCHCGNEKEYKPSDVIRGKYKSCGCLQGWHKHGLSKHPLASRHRGMLQRCYNPTHASYELYGGRGITVCERWHSVDLFIADILTNLGECPYGHTLDRIDNNGNYELSNVRWATLSEQRINQREVTRGHKPIEIEGVLYPSVSAAAKALEVSRRTIIRRYA